LVAGIPETWQFTGGPLAGGHILHGKTAMDIVICRNVAATMDFFGGAYPLYYEDCGIRAVLPVGTNVWLEFPASARFPAGHYWGVVRSVHMR
jgi:hypothetical protein